LTQNQKIQKPKEKYIFCAIKAQIRKNERNTRLDLTQLYVYKRQNQENFIVDSGNLTVFDQK